MKEAVQGTGYQDSLRKHLPGKPHGCPALTVTVITHATETIAKGSSEL